MQSNWCLTPSGDRARVSKVGGGGGVGLRHAPLENFKKIEVQRCNLMHFEAYGNRKINVNLRQPVSIFHGKVHNLREF